MVITSNDPINPTEYIAVTGEGVEPHILVNPLSLDYGSVLVGSDSTQQFSIENTGTSELSGDITTPADFTVASRSIFVKGNGAKNVLSFNIPVGQTLVYDLTFTPTLEQTYSDSVIITSNDPNNLTEYIAVTGQGVEPHISVNPLSLDYGQVLVGSDSTQQFSIENTGSSELSGDITTPTDFTVASRSIYVKGNKGAKNVLSFNIPAGQTLVYNLTFTPTLEQTYSDSVIITSNDPNNPIEYIAVTGEGIVILDAPENVVITITDSLTITWNPVTYADVYKIWSSDNPYTGFTTLEDTVPEESWTTSIPQLGKRFYYIIAKTQPPVKK